MTVKLRIPPERDLPRGRLAQRRDHLIRELDRRVQGERSLRGRPVPHRWAAVAGVAAAAALIAVAVPALLPGGRRGGAQNAAAAALLRAAKVAATRDREVPPGPGQYVYTRTKAVWQNTYAGAGPNGDGDFSVLMPVVREAWIGPDGAGRLLEKNGTPTFLTAEDRSTWVASGRPDLGGNRTHDDAFEAGGLFYQDLSRLPTDPGALRRMIEERTVEGGPPGDAESFTIIGDLLRETYASPELRASLYRIASDLPGVELIGNVRDPVGRQGVAVAYPSKGMLQELIFDPDTSESLGERTVVQDPGQARIDVAAGTVVGWSAYLASGVVNSTDQRP